MMRKLVIPLFMIAALGASSTEVRAAAAQSLHFRVIAPNAGGLKVGVKSSGLPTINGTANLTVGDSGEVVSRKAAEAACIAAFNQPSLTCIRTTGGGGGSCNTGPACCSDFITAGFTVDVACNRGGTTPGFDLSHAPGTGVDFVSATGGGGDISHMTCDSSNVYPDLGVDIASRSLIQVRPNGLTGTVQIKIYKGSPTTPAATANIVVSASNNDPSEAQSLHAAIETALEGLALTPPIVATTHHLVDAAPPLTVFTNLKQASHFVEIANITAAGITEVEVTVPGGPGPVMGITLEGSDNALPDAVPTLNAWGIVALVVMLILAGYVLRRRQMAGTATT